MKKIGFLLMTTVFSVLLQAQVSKTVSIGAGDLSSVLTGEEKNEITDLTITGTIDARDFKTMRDSMGFLSVVDLSGVTIASYSGDSGTSTGNPSGIDYPENAIPEFAFYNSHSHTGNVRLTSLVLPQTTTTIGANSFYACSGLVSIQLFSGVTSIGDNALNKCSNLTSINIPSTVTYLGNSVFNDCSSLTSITIPSSVTRIGHSAFSGCTNLAAIELLASIDRIDNYTFSLCRSLKEIIIPSSVTSIGNFAFTECTGITSIIFPSMVNEIGWNAFENCTGLKSIDIPSSIRHIQSNTFKNCIGITSINIPSTVTYIWNDAFTNCGGYFTVDAANPSYSSAEGVLFDKNQTRLIRYPFLKAGPYATPLSVTTIDNYAFSFCVGLTSIEISQSVKEIKDQAFIYCRNIATITIPSSVTVIGENAFNACSGYIIVDPNNPSYSSADGVLFNKNRTQLLFCPVSKRGNYSIPSSVISIVNNAFNGCDSLTSVDIPPTVISIGELAFGECSGLVSIVIPSSVVFIGNFGFYGCKGLQTVDIPSSITSLGQNSFMKCTDLRSIRINIRNPIWIIDVFEKEIQQNCTLYVPYGSKAIYKNNYDWGGFVHIEEMEGFSLSANEIYLLPGEGSNDSVIVNSNIVWTATSDQLWLAVSPNSGLGNGFLTFIAEANPLNTTRSATVTITADGVPRQSIHVTQSNHTGLSPILKTAIDLYPNPVNNGFTIKGVVGAISLELYGLDGKLLFSKTVIENEYIPVNSLTTGIYYIKLFSPEGTVEKRLIKK
jgi:hypothetical protein